MHIPFGVPDRRGQTPHPEAGRLEIRSPEMQVQTERKRACMYAGRENQRGRPH